MSDDNVPLFMALFVILVPELAMDAWEWIKGKVSR